MITMLLQQLFLVKSSLRMKIFVTLLLVILSSEVPDDLVFGQAPSFSWRESVSVYLELSSRQLLSLNQKKMISSSFQISQKAKHAS